MPVLTKDSKEVQIKDKNGALLAHICGDMPLHLKSRLISLLKSCLETHGNIKWVYHCSADKGDVDFYALHMTTFCRNGKKVSS